MEWVILLLRTLFFYTLVVLVMKAFTYESKIRLVDLMVAFMIALLSVVAIVRPSAPLMIYLTPILLLTTVHLFSRLLFREREKVPIHPIPKAMPISRSQSFADVEMGMLDPLPSQAPPPRLPLPLILDGKVLDHNLERLGKTRFWLKNEVQEFGVSRFKEVSYCSIDQQGRMYLDRKKS
ncbi:YetF domain-containing protein [Ammoniphilus resinae]|uniref:Uncharacterized membrane protein YcaP (DUF421 family) n=1 Tax=Ammoniphilus resinae TaxID=861532 RepID=A0ABS4GK16_9BACL|nr:YetF domain-containing protein [Ammoniphilus resinae]MBP1930442.1 uncharacterized membrane protein YcaP (DUF421 family) [Ammoniphilus resinae]